MYPRVPPPPAGLYLITRGVVVVRVTAVHIGATLADHKISRSNNVKDA